MKNVPAYSGYWLPPLYLADEISTVALRADPLTLVWMLREAPEVSMFHHA